MHHKLRPGTYFEVAKAPAKYVAVLPDGHRVSFGHRDYQHYRDQVP